MRRKTPGDNCQLEDVQNEYSKIYYANEDESGSNLNEQSQNDLDSEMSDQPDDEMEDFSKVPET